MDTDSSIVSANRKCFSQVILTKSDWESSNETANVYKNSLLCVLVSFWLTTTCHLALVPEDIWMVRALERMQEDLILHLLNGLVRFGDDLKNKESSCLVRYFHNRL